MSGPWLGGQGVATIVVRRTGDVDPYTCSYGFAHSNPTVAQLDIIGIALANAAKPNLSLVDSVDVVSWRWKESDAGDVQMHDTGASLTGTLSNAVTSQNVAFLLKKRAGVGGRHGRGRSFWPCVPEADVDPLGVVTAAALTRLQTMCTAFLTAFRASAVTVTDMTILPAAAGTGHVVTSLTPDGLVATQRRRLRR